LGEGDSETIQNFVPNPSFEFAGTALADWTESKTATGTTARSTTTAKFGDASLALVMTNSGGSGQVIERNVTLADVDAAEVWSFQAWVRIDALSNCKVAFMVDYTHGADVEVESTSVDASNWVKLTLNNNTVPGSTTAATIRCRLESTASSATGTVYFDGITAVQAAAVPTTFVSGHSLVNHFDDDGQAHVNYIDLYDIPGDQFAKLKVTALEAQAHTKFWAGARHGSRMTNASLFHEGEDFSGFTSSATGDASGGAFGYVGVGGPAFVSAHSATASGANSITDSITVSGTDTYMVVACAGNDSGASTPWVSGVTFDGDALSPLYTDGAGLQTAPSIMQMFYFKNPAAKTANVVASYTGTIDYLVMGTLILQGIDDTGRQRNTGAPYYYEGKNARSTGGSTSVTVTDTTSQAGDIVFAFTQSATSTTGAGYATDHTERLDVQSGLISMQLQTFVATGTSTVMAHTINSAPWSTSSTSTVPVAAPNAANPAVGTLDIASPPLGTYLILERWGNPNGARWGTRLSHTYGGITNDPTVAAHYNDLPASQTAFHVKEGGNLVVPPSRLPDGSTIGTLQLRMCSYQVSGASTDTLRLDWVMLLPVDEGFAYATKASGTDAVVIDTIGEPSQIALETSAGVFQSRPESMGRGIYGSPDGTRIYMIADDAVDATITDGWTVSVKVVPQYLMVGGE